LGEVAFFCLKIFERQKNMENQEEKKPIEASEASEANEIMDAIAAELNASKGDDVAENVVSNDIETQTAIDKKVELPYYDVQMPKDFWHQTIQPQLPNYGLPNTASAVDFMNLLVTNREKLLIQQQTTPSVSKPQKSSFWSWLPWVLAILAICISIWLFFKNKSAAIHTWIKSPT
jgi:hypothetical protein